MITDALDDTGELVLGGSGGFLAGLAAAALMLAVLAVWHPAAGAAGVLAAIGRTVWRGASRPGAALAAGALAHFGIGGVCGMLYGVCQQRVPLRGLVVVGLFYGFIIWLVSNWVSRAGFGAAVKGLLHSRLWLLASLVYGLALAAAAALAERRRPAGALRPAAVD